MCLCKDLLHNVCWFDTGKALIKTLKFERQLFVVNSQTVQDGGIQVTDVNGIFNDVVAIVVRLAVLNSTLNTAAGHPDGEAAAVVVATIFFPG